jgi:glutamine amidotransferase
LEARLSLLALFAADLRLLGPANFLYADGDALFAHGHRRRQRAIGRAEPPGLWALQRHCAPADPTPDRKAGVSIAQGKRAALFIASVPLTDEAWRPLSEGELVAVRNGEVLATRFPVAI